MNPQGHNKGVVAVTVYINGNGGEFILESFYTTMKTIVTLQWILP